MSLPVTLNELPGWSVADQNSADYAIWADRTVFWSGEISATIEANRNPHDMATVMQLSESAAYRGKWIRMTGYVKAVNVQGWASLWLRVDAGNRALAFDNMQDRPIMGTSEWAKYSIELDVPPQSDALAFGLLLEGSGQVWLDDVTFEVVGQTVSMTGDPTPIDNPLIVEIRSSPRNLDFELVTPQLTTV